MGISDKYSVQDLSKQGIKIFFHISLKNRNIGELITCRDLLNWRSPSFSGRRGTLFVHVPFHGDLLLMPYSNCLSVFTLIENIQVFYSALEIILSSMLKIWISGSIYRDLYGDAFPRICTSCVVPRIIMPKIKNRMPMEKVSAIHPAKGAVTIVTTERN